MKSHLLSDKRSKAQQISLRDTRMLKRAPIDKLKMTQFNLSIFTMTV